MRYLTLNSYDLILFLLDPYVEFVQDGTRNEEGSSADREKYNEQIKTF